MILYRLTFDSSIMFAGFALGFSIGFLVSLIKYIITAVIRWMKS